MSEHDDDDAARAAALAEVGDDDCDFGENADDNGEELGDGNNDFTGSPSGGDTKSPQQEDEWAKYEDDEGRTYYYNATSGESAWNPPPGFQISTQQEASSEVQDFNHDDDGFGQSPSADELGGAQSPPAEYDADAEDYVVPDSSNSERQVESALQSAAWVLYQDDEGRDYYYNTETQETQWNKPDGMTIVVPPEKSVDVEMVDDSGVAQQPYNDNIEMDFVMEQEPVSALPDPESPEPEPKEPELDPKEVALERAQNALNEPDAILEPSCLLNVGELVNGLGGSVGGKKAIDSLAQGFVGQTAICGLLATWLADLKSSHSTAADPTLVGGSTLSMITQGDPFAAGADAARSIAEDVIKKLAKERFTKEGGDSILSLSKAEAAFLEDMMENDRWRRLLIDLSAVHKDSALLVYCLQSISKRGHHREIAKRINQSDYFGVFNSMLASELAVLGKIAVVGGSSEIGDGAVAPEIGIEGLVQDLRRTCTSTSYTYVYAMEVLDELVLRAKAKKMSNTPKALGIRRAIRKWERLKEELEETMVKSSASNVASNGMNPLQRKRRVAVALTVSELHQRQRRRINPMSSESALLSLAKENGYDKKKSTDLLRYSLDSGVVDLLRKHSQGMQIDDQLAEQLLRNPNESSKDRVGELLIAHPSAISSLMHNLFRPGSGRVRSLETRLKCAKLIALAVLASERAILAHADAESENEVNGTPDVDKDAFSKMILSGSQLCEQVEHLVSFTVTECVDDVPAISVGGQLSSLCIKNAFVAQGFLLWATERAQGPEFVASAAYPTLAPGVLSLARIIAKHHPFLRHSVLSLSWIFLKHSNSELSFQKTKEIKEQSIRLLLWLSTLGMAMNVFDALGNKLRQGGSAEIDSSLLRFFFAGALDIIRPPLSVPVVRALGTMMSTKAAMDALNSPYFDVSGKKLLKELIGYFGDTVSEERSKFSRATAEDRTLVASLSAIYCGN